MAEITAPSYKVEGQDLPAPGPTTIRLEIEETSAGLRTLTARMLAQGPRQGYQQETQLYLDGGVFDLGKRIEVALGPQDQQVNVFRGVISALEADFMSGDPTQSHVVVFAEDRLMRLRMTHRCHTYKQKSDADIVRDIAQQHGLSAQATADGPTYDVVQQWNMSDLAFLRERALLIGAEVWIDGDTLHFESRGQRSGTSITLSEADDLLAIQVRADLAHQRSKVVVSGYDAAHREAINEESGADAIQAEISSGRTGPQVLETALGERPSYRVRQAPLKTQEATAFAKAEMLRRSRAFVVASGVTRGTPNMVVGSHLTLQGIGQPFSGDGYYATRVCHTYDQRNGLRTEFQAERATLNEASS